MISREAKTVSRRQIIHAKTRTIFDTKKTQTFSV